MDTVVYQYYTDGFWASYDEPTSQQIEFARELNLESVVLTEGLYQEDQILHGTYEILFKLELQRNLTTGFCRNIRRICGKVTGFDPIPIFDGDTTEKFSELFVTLSASEAAHAHECNVCLSPFIEETDGGGPAIRLPKCSGHFFHMECIEEWLQEKHQCPYCKTFYGVQKGNCPEGDMIIRHLKKKLPSFEGDKSSGTWMVTWDIDSGIQDSTHQNPGLPFYGTTRHGYLPDSEAFRKVLRMFQIAWKRRLMFTVGTSLTTGFNNVIIWNGIHVRTEWEDRSGFGWPAPGYMDSVTSELRAKGITEDQIGDE